MLPVKQTSRCRKRKRRSHHALSALTLSGCPKCGKSKLPHAACGTCGYVSSKVSLRRSEQED